MPLLQGKAPHEHIYDILMDKDEITWQSLLTELIKTEQMDPWDIDVSLLTKKFIETVKELKELDFKVSGKVILAAAILLKIKSNRLVGEDIEYLDRLMSQQEEEELLSFEETVAPRPAEDIPKDLIPRTPQERKRKVSIYDLMQALERALEVKRRRVLRSIPPMEMELPKRKRDISEIIKEVYMRISQFFLGESKTPLRFSSLTPSNSKEDKIATFVPLLHLATAQRVGLHQEKHFSDFEITLCKGSQLQEEPIAPEGFEQEKIGV